jgi:hypothetical protein
MNIVNLGKNIKNWFALGNLGRTFTKIYLMVNQLCSQLVSWCLPQMPQKPGLHPSRSSTSAAVICEKSSEVEEPAAARASHCVDKGG